MSDVEREEEQTPAEKPVDDESEQPTDDPWETQDQPHEGEEGQSEEVA